MISPELAPNYSKISREYVTLPFRTEPYLKLTFAEELLNGYQVFVIADSVTQNKRLTTFIARFPRPALAEVNTHRVFSRNSASSRAQSNPYIPLYTKNQKGMAGARGTIANQEELTRIHLKGRDSAVATVLRSLLGEQYFEGISDETIVDEWDHHLEVYSKMCEADDLGFAWIPNGQALSTAKQVFNRYLEPFMWHEAIITSSYWDNFISLRNHDAADPVIRGMAALIEEGLNFSSPDETWVHLPFVDPNNFPARDQSFAEIKDILLKSSAECAQISYNDKSAAARSSATVGLGERLLAMGHLSPFEHVAFDSKTYFNEIAKLSTGVPTKPREVMSNFDPAWVQLRPILSGITK